MFLKYGSYQHDPSEVALMIDKEAILSPDGVQFAERIRWDIVGRIHASNQATVNAAVKALEAAYSRNNQDAGFYMDDGTPTAHVLINSQSLYGVKVVRPPRFPQGDGGEFSTFRNYQISLEAEYPTTTDGVLMGYEETIQFRGTGGSKWRLRETLNTVPQIQFIKQATVIHVIQQGRAEAVGAYPYPPNPIWPDYEHLDLREIGRASMRDKYRRKSVTWAYHFSAAVNVQNGMMYSIPTNSIALSRRAGGYL